MPRAIMDYIAIGAGSAGCVIAGRLGKDPELQTLLLEAGGEDIAASIRMPARFAELQDSPYD